MYRAVLAVARGMAVLGGVMLTGLIVMTCLSILGRSLNGILKGDVVQSIVPGLADWLVARGVAPILGDFELVEAGIAFAVFAFLPLCQITGGHAKVDIFTTKLPTRLDGVWQAVIDVVFALVLVVIAWRLQVGMADKAEYSETTFMLQFPVWWAYGLSLFAAVVAAGVAVYVAIARVAEGLTGQVILPRSEGPDA